MIVVDAHEDLAWNVLTFGRDYLRSVSETRALEQHTPIPTQNGTVLLGWDEWLRGSVGVIFATLFASPTRWKYGEWDTLSYADREDARRLYLKNLVVYQRLFERHPDKFCLIRNQGDLRRSLETREDGPEGSAPIGLVLLMEGAEAIRKPDELGTWFESGLRILSLSWAGNQYAGGTHEPGPITPMGFTLLERMAELGMILDLSHLPDEAVRKALDVYPGGIIASHSNPLRRLPGHESPERHLTDEAIIRIAERDGVIGTVVYNPFIKDKWDISLGREAVMIEDVAVMIDYVCQLIGDADHIGFGTDFDGGFGLEHIPQGLDSIADLQKIGTALSERGYSQVEVEGVLGMNWLRLLENGLSET
jgi:membrane dipeptidase